MLNEMEKEYLRKVVEIELGKFQKEEKTVLDNMSPGFMKGEAEFEDFLKALIEKLK